MTKVFALGSCRLMSPLKKLYKRQLIDLVNYEQSWYAHNTREFLQRIDFLGNKSCISDDMRGLVMDIDSCSFSYNNFKPYTEFPEIALFEVSTRIVKSFDNIYLHSTCLAKNNNNNYKEVLLDFSELEGDIVKLSKLFRRLIIVCNIDYDVDLISTHYYRRELNVFLEGLRLKYDGIEVVNPNSLVDQKEPKNDLIDYNHFTESFTLKMSDYFFKILT